MYRFGVELQIGTKIRKIFETHKNTDIFLLLFLEKDFDSSKKYCNFAGWIMEQQKVIERIKDVAERILPQGASLWLYGSRARGDARPDSDYDLLILLDKEKITSEDFDNYSYPFCESGYEIWTEINPHIYTRNDWMSWSFSPFYKNVEHDKIVLK